MTSLPKGWVSQFSISRPRRIAKLGSSNAAGDSLKGAFESESDIEDSSGSSGEVKQER